jgi:hypothetical protein
LTATAGANPDGVRAIDKNRIPRRAGSNALNGKRRE